MTEHNGITVINSLDELARSQLPKVLEYCAKNGITVITKSSPIWMGLGSGGNVVTIPHEVINPHTLEVLVIHFPNDNAHCIGKGCDRRHQCLRFLAWKDKCDRKIDAQVSMVQPNPETCDLFIDVKVRLHE